MKKYYTVYFLPENSWENINRSSDVLFNTTDEELFLRQLTDNRKIYKKEVQNYFYTKGHKSHIGFWDYIDTNVKKFNEEIIYEKNKDRIEFDLKEKQESINYLIEEFQ